MKFAKAGFHLFFKHILIFTMTSVCLAAQGPGSEPECQYNHFWSPGTRALVALTKNEAMETEIYSLVISSPLMEKTLDGWMDNLPLVAGLAFFYPGIPSKEVSSDTALKD